MDGVKVINIQEVRSSMLKMAHGARVQQQLWQDVRELPAWAVSESSVILEHSSSMPRVASCKAECRISCNRMHTWCQCMGGVRLTRSEG
eukprot:1153133-Pelagomonas_calceolata.AAC.6